MLVTKAGDGTIACCGQPMAIKAAGGATAGAQASSQEAQRG